MTVKLRRSLAPLDLGTAFGITTRTLRTLAHLSKREAAERLGIARPNYSRLERGDHTPSLESLLRVADAFDVSPESLLRAVLETATERASPSPSGTPPRRVDPAPPYATVVEEEHRHRGFSTWELAYLTAAPPEETPRTDRSGNALRARRVAVRRDHAGRRPPG